MTSAVALFNDTAFINGSIGNGTTESSEIQTQIEQTCPLGTSDLDYFFDKNHALLANSSTYSNSDQRSQDIALAQKQTLDFLIQGLAFNTTMSFLTNDLLSPPVPTPVLTTTSLNLYAYHTTNLLLAYGLAIIFAMLGKILAGLAYRHNRASYDTFFSSFLVHVRDPALADLFGHQELGRLPLAREIGKARLRCEGGEGVSVREGLELGWGFVVGYQVFYMAFLGTWGGGFFFGRLGVVFPGGGGFLVVTRG